VLAAAQARLTMGVWLLFDGFGVAVGAFQLERFLITYIKNLLECDVIYV